LPESGAPAELAHRDHVDGLQLLRDHDAVGRILDRGVGEIAVRGAPDALGSRVVLEEQGTQPGARGEHQAGSGDTDDAEALTGDAAARDAAEHVLTDALAVLLGGVLFGGIAIGHGHDLSYSAQRALSRVRERSTRLATAPVVVPRRLAASL